jgi:hypothetical protein
MKTKVVLYEADIVRILSEWVSENVVEGVGNVVLAVEPVLDPITGDEVVPKQYLVSAVAEFSQSLDEEDEEDEKNGV